MREQPTEKQSKLIGALREGVAVVQMVFFKEEKNRIKNQTEPRTDWEKKIMKVQSNSMFSKRVSL